MQISHIIKQIDWIVTECREFNRSLYGWNCLSIPPCLD